MIKPNVSMTWAQYKRRECLIFGVDNMLSNINNVRLFTFNKRSDLALELLVLLLIRFPQPTSFDDILAFLWPDPDSEPEDVEKTLDNTLRFLSRQGVKLDNMRRTHGRVTMTVNGWRLSPSDAVKIPQGSNFGIKCQALCVDRYRPRYGQQCQHNATLELDGFGWVCYHHKMQWDKIGRRMKRANNGTA